MVADGYKQTEIGVIPEDWDVLTMGEIGENIAGLTYSPNDVSEYGTLVLRSSNIQNNKLAYNNNVFVNMDLPKRVIVREGDLLICVRNGSKRLIGKCALIDKEVSGNAFGAFMSVYRCEYNKFIFQMFQSNIIMRQIDETMGATINQLTNKDLSRFKIPIPPKQEQKAIATVLSDTDALIDALEKLIAKKEAIKTGTMQQLLTGKKRLDGFSGEWVEKRLEEVAKVKMGQSPSSIYYNTNAIGLPLVQGNADIKNRKTIIRNYTSQITRKAFINDIIMSVRAPVGEIAIATFNSCIGRGVCAITAKNAFIYHYLVFIEPKWSSLSTGSTFDSVTSEVVKSLMINLPIDTEEQQAIATILSDMDKEIETLKNKLVKLKAIKDGMMQELLSGKTGLLGGENND